MSDQVNEHNALYPLDDYTLVIGQCAITREVVSPLYSNHWVGASIHICAKHNLWVVWPSHLTQINKPQGIQAHIAGALDRNETLGLIP